MAEAETENSNCNCFLFLLPYHIQCEIINFLDYSDKLHARSCCTYLKDLVDENWTDIKISAKPLLGYAACLVTLKSFLSERSERVVSIAWKNFVYSVDSLFSTMPAILPNVMKLELKSISVETVVKLSAVCLSIRELTFDFVTNQRDEEEEIWFQIGQSFPQLTAIS